MGRSSAVRRLNELFAAATDDRERSIFAETLAALVREGRGLGGRDVEGGSLRRFLAEPSLFALKRGSADFDLGAPGASEIPDIVRNSVTAAGLTYEQDLDERLIRDAGGGDAMSLLQFTLQRLFEERQAGAAAIAAQACGLGARSDPLAWCRASGSPPSARRSNSSNASSACRRVRSILPRSQSISATTIGAWVGTSTQRRSAARNPAGYGCSGSASAAANRDRTSRRDIRT